MGIGYFPVIYPDELIYSVLARYYVHSGYEAYIFCAESLFLDKGVRPDIEFVNDLKPEIVNLLCRNITMEETILKHTMFPYYGRFLPQERRCGAFQAMCSMKGNYYNLLAVPQMKHRKQRYLRYCPLCAGEDKEQYGETYWHRSHQLMNVAVCHKHGCKLRNSTVLISGKVSPDLIAAEREADSTDTIDMADIMEGKLAAYIADVFQAPLDIERDVQVKYFLQSRLEGSSYLSVRGEQKKTGLLCEDFRNYYEELNDEEHDIPDRSRIEKILTGYRFNFYEIGLLGYFLNISATDLIHMELPGTAQKQVFDKKVMQMLNVGIGINETARRLGVSSKTVRDVRNHSHKEKRAVKQYSVNCGAKAKDWKRIDRETLPTVKGCIQNLKGDEIKRPKRVTRFAICRMLNLPDKRFDYLPLCRAEIFRYSESWEQYWAREIVWAVNKIQREGSTLNWRHIRVLTNMRKDNLIACLPHLEELAEPELVEQVRAVL